jgi:hypothetical protein
MSRKSDPLSDSFGTDDAEGWLGGIVADEDDFDRHALWRLGLWGFAAVGALTLGILSGQLPINAQHTQLAAGELAGRAKQVESTVEANQLEARRLAAAIETLNSDRDRLFARLSSLEQGIDVITGSIKKAEDKPAPVPWPEVTIAPIIESAPPTIAAPAILAPALAPTPAPEPPIAAPVAVAPPSEPERVTIAVAARSDVPPAETPAAPPSVIQAMPIPDPQPVEANAAPAEESAVAQADFGIDLGSANSVNGLRALWRGLVKSHKSQLDGLRPLIAVHERKSGLGLQLRLIAGPIKDAADAARVCAVLSDAKRDCKTTAFDGQRLSLAAEPEQKAGPSRPQARRKSTRVREQAPAPAPATPASSVASMLGLR